jgi:hypothetical protein
MPHEVETMAYFGRLPWHGLGTALEEDDRYDWPKASAQAGLNWEAELVPLVTTTPSAGSSCSSKPGRRPCTRRGACATAHASEFSPNSTGTRWSSPRAMKSKSTCC